MKSLNEDVQIYTHILQQGQIQRAYRGILHFMSELNRSWKQEYPEWTTRTLYAGYLDMTYFSATPPFLEEKGLKIALVYLHRENRFECWLAGTNRSKQEQYRDHLQHQPSPYKLTPPGPGVDSIMVCSLVESPDFDHPELLKKQMMDQTLHFVEDLSRMIESD